MSAIASQGAFVLHVSPDTHWCAMTYNERDGGFPGDFGYSLRLDLLPHPIITEKPC